MNLKRLILASFLLTAYSISICSQERIVPIRFGNMETWVVRYIKESALLGGKTKTLYNLGPTDTIRQNKAYNFRKTIWGISNAYANPAGIDKAATSTQPEKRGKGYCARLDTRIETVKVLGFIDIEVCIAGSLFLGDVCEPVKSASDPYSSINVGYPFTGKPKALLFDIKAKVSPEHKVLKATGFGSKKWFDGHDEPEVYVYLQKRWEDKDGNIYAKRIGTVRKRFATSIPEWQNDYRLDIDYGDITEKPYFKEYMGLFPAGGQFKARNSKGKMVRIQEVGWGTPDDQPTHVILMITAGCYPAFYGHPGNALWIDNLRWVY